MKKDDNNNSEDNELQDWELSVNDNCIWCWSCVAIYPEIFDFDDEWKAFVKKWAQKTDDIDIDDVIWLCPVGAICSKKNI